MEAAKTGQSRNGEIVFSLMRITILNRVTPYSEQSLLYRADIHNLVKNHVKQQN